MSLCVIQSTKVLYWGLPLRLSWLTLLWAFCRQSRLMSVAPYQFLVVSVTPGPLCVFSKAELMR